MQPFRLIKGSTPLIISIPHMGTFLPADIKSRMTDAGKSVADTDWHLDRLYDFAPALGASVLMSSYSRYVVDLNRPADDAALYAGQVKTGLVPLQSFSGEDLYIDGEEPDAVEKINRIAAYWTPYHDALMAEIQRVKNEFGYAILYDAHSIKSEVPRLFDGVLPDLNIGTVHGESCDDAMARSLERIAGASNYSHVLNGRFIGGYITRAYGAPDQDVHALQMELAEKNYMNEKTFAYDENLAPLLAAVLKESLIALLVWGDDHYPSSRKNI